MDIANGIPICHSVVRYIHPWINNYHTGAKQVKIVPLVVESIR